MVRMEIEAKFDIPDQQSFEFMREQDQLAGLVLGAPRVESVHDIYLDTKGRALLAAGYACRRREHGQRSVVTVKSFGRAEGAIHRREELEVEVGAAQQPQEWPDSDLRALVLRLIGDEPLVPLLQIEQKRTVRRGSQGARVVAELSLDDVCFHAGEKRQHTWEMETELIEEGTEGDLAAFSASLTRDWHLRPEPCSKFERALALLDGALGTGNLLTAGERCACESMLTQRERYRRRAQLLLALDEGADAARAGMRAGLSPRRARYWTRAFRERRLSIFPDRLLAQALPREISVEATGKPAPPVGESGPGVSRDDGMGEAARKILLFHFYRMLEHEPGTRSGENVEELHDMRVATRRMRAAFVQFGSYVDQDAYRKFRKSLRRTGRALGRARDLDVFHGKMQSYLDSLPSQDKSGLDPLLAAWQREYDTARIELLDYLDSLAFAEFKEEFAEFLRTPAVQVEPTLSGREGPHAFRVAHVLPVILYDGASRVRAFEEWLAGPDAPPTRYHQLRIASKQLRYSLEFFLEILRPEAKGLIAKVKALQDHLGHLQDAVVVGGIVSNFLAHGTWGSSGAHEGEQGLGPVIAPGVAAYLAFEQEQIQELKRSFPEVWKPILSPKFKQGLAKIVAAL